MHIMFGLLWKIWNAEFVVRRVSGFSLRSQEPQGLQQLTSRRASKGAKEKITGGISPGSGKAALLFTAVTTSLPFGRPLPPAYSRFLL
jgi:hypothetical protein